MPRRPPRPPCGRALQRSSSQLTSTLISDLSFGSLGFDAIYRRTLRTAVRSFLGWRRALPVRTPRHGPSEPRRQHVSPADHEALLNDTDAVADKPVEPQAGG